MVVYAYNSSTWEAEEGGFGVQGQPDLLVRPCLKTSKEKDKTKQNKSQEN
jgi:hypothetical protein